jgi:putative membrane-bound dehydrogenase-like protein
MKRSRRIILAVILLPIILGILALAGVGALTLVRRVTESARTAPPPRTGIVLPPGFVADVYAQPPDAEVPSLVTFDPQGRMIVMTVGGKLFQITDADGDQQGETVIVLYDNADRQLVQAVGLAFHEGTMYISDSGRISTFADSDSDGKLDTLTPIVEGLPSLIFPDHSNNGIAFGPDGKLYVGVGATTDHGPLQVDLEASVLRMNPDGSDLEVFATGFRNPYDLAFSPEGDLFTADNNPSELDETLRFLPPEELVHVQQGRDYGFPRVYGFAFDPQGSAPPVTEFYASVGSAGIAYYAADAFPQEWRDGVYVAQWGTGANVALDRGITNGQSVVFIALQRTPDGQYSGQWKPFLWFDTDENQRPVDVAVGPDGALYVLEFSTATVYRVHYTGTITSAAPVATPTREPLPVFAAEQVTLGESLFKLGASGIPACSTCHLDGGRIGLGPSLAGLRDRAGQRVPGLGAVDYVRESILKPNDYIVPGFNAGYMYQDYAAILTEEQLTGLVAYLLTLE